MSAAGRGLIKNATAAMGAGVGTASGGVNAEVSQISKYSGESLEMAAETLMAAQAHASESAATLAPVLGPLGADFVAAFAKAEASHLDGATRLAAAQVGMGLGTADAAKRYVAQEQQNSDEFHSIRSSQA